MRDERKIPNPNRIDGVPWYEAMKPCRCGTMPTVWRTYIETTDRRRYMCRCYVCDREVQAKSRNRVIRDWNEAIDNPQYNPLSAGGGRL